MSCFGLKVLTSAKRMDFEADLHMIGGIVY